MSNKPSLLSKLKNKVNYKINEAVDDPEANKYAEEQKKLTLILFHAQFE